MTTSTCRPSTYREAILLADTTDDKLFLKVFSEGYIDLLNSVNSIDTPEYRTFFNRFCNRSSYPDGFAKELCKIEVNGNNVDLFSHFISVSSDEEFEIFMELIN